ncbi:VWA domain-containing protein [Candidatus Gracilibacteria bacterium]|nr:VWA domain-containing protein [Candidatus Gracilibacteria bacterium]
MVLVIDHSGSMAENDPQFLRLAAAKLFIDLADPEDKIGVVVLSDAAQTRSLTPGLVPMARPDNGRELKALIDGLRTEPMGEETHVGSALSAAYDLLATTDNDGVDANQRQFVVLLTDGRPTGVGQLEQVAATVERFQARRFWRIFSIALGADADPAYLQQAVAAPTSALVVMANDATELIDSYLDVYTRASDDRFVDRIIVEPNTLAQLAQVQAQHQPTQLSVYWCVAECRRRSTACSRPTRTMSLCPFPEYRLSQRRAGIRTVQSAAAGSSRLCWQLADQHRTRGPDADTDRGSNALEAAHPHAGACAHPTRRR